MNNTHDVGLVLLSSDFRVIGINDYARLLFGPMLKEMGHSILLCHARKTRERVSGMLRELTRASAGAPRTMIIDVVGKVIIFNVSRLSVISPVPHTYWSVSFIDVSKQTGAVKASPGGTVEMKRIPVFENGGYRFLSLRDVFCVQSDGDYCKVFTKDKSYYLHLSLKAILERYPGAAFFRAHRSFIVNLDHISKISRSGKGQMRIAFLNESIPSVPVSRRKLAELRKTMRHL